MEQQGEGKSVLDTNSQYTQDDHRRRLEDADSPNESRDVHA